MNIKPLLLATCLLFACLAGVQAQTPSSQDLWDVSSGVTVTTNSPLDEAWGDPFSYDAANIFGATNGTYLEGQLGRVVFADYQPDGFVHFVEWRTPAPVTVRSFRLFAWGDGNGLREFAEFHLLAKTNGSPSFSTVFTFTPTHPYTSVDPTNFLLLQASIKAITAQEFRAEFVNLAGLPPYYNAPRIVELDGFGEYLDLKPAIRTSQVEVCWDAILGVQYQVEYQSALTGGSWLPLGDPVAGNGTRMSITDAIPPGSPNRFYRVCPLP